MQEYKKGYQQLIADVGDALRTADIEKLDYFNKTLLLSRRSLAQADTPWTGLGLLRALEEAGLFNYRRPGDLATALCEAKREDQQRAVEEFIDTHRHLLVCGVKGKAVLPRGTAKDGPYHNSKLKTVPAPTAVAASAEDSEDSEDPYVALVPFSKVAGLHLQGSPNSSPSSPPLAPLQSSETADSACGDDDGYSYPYSHEWTGGSCLTIAMAQTVSPESSLSTTSVTSSDDKPTAEDSTDDESEYFEYPVSRESWLTTAGAQRLKLTQKMQLQVSPLQLMVKRYENNTITSELIKWQLFCQLLELRLHIDPIGSCEGIAATLLLQRRIKASLSGNLTAKLTVSQPRSQPVKKSQLPNSRRSSSLNLFSCSVVMDIPDETTPPDVPSIVARFPMILSHKNLLNKKLIQGPHLDITLTLRQHNT